MSEDGAAVGIEMGRTYESAEGYNDKNGALTLDQTAVAAMVEYDDDGRVARTGTLWSAAAHVITAVVGSGVLSLAWAIAQMGWVAGPLVLLAFGGVTYYTSLMLADCYRHPDPIHGKRNPTYMQAVKAYLGPKQVMACGILQYVNLFGTCVGYTITSSHSLVAMGKAECYHKHGHEAHCDSKLRYYMIGFGVVQILFSQIPDFDQLWWLSILAAIMSFSYSGIGLGLGLAEIAENGEVKGTLTGTRIGTGPDELEQSKKVYQIFSALGAMAFAYAFSTILNNVQDTLKSPPAENKIMKKVTLIATITTTIFYMLVGCAGYGAFGNVSPGDLMTGFGFYEPSWLVIAANLAIVIHLVGAYQVFAQAVFSFLEGVVVKRMPKSKFINAEYQVASYRVSPLRLTLRTMFVCVTTILGLLMPFFTDVMGLLGALGFFPLTIYFPVQMYIVQSNTKCYSRRWWGLQSLTVVCFFVSACAAIGSVASIITDVKHAKPFE